MRRRQEPRIGPDYTNALALKTSESKHPGTESGSPVARRLQPPDGLAGQPIATTPDADDRIRLDKPARVAIGSATE